MAWPQENGRQAAPLIYRSLVAFDSVRMRKHNPVGERNRGWYVGAALLDFERSGVDRPPGPGAFWRSLCISARGTLVTADLCRRSR